MAWAIAEPFYRLSASLNELNEFYPSFKPDEHWFCRCPIYKHQVAVTGLCEFCKKNSG